MSTPILAIDGLVKRYGGFTAVDGISLELHPGQILALLGPNGAGKTTTIRVVMGQLHPTAGSARIAGHDCWSERPAAMRVTGHLPDEPAFHDHLTGRELVRFVGHLHRLDPSAIAAACDDLAVRLGIAGDLDEYAVNYSLGMRKRLGLVLALMHRPRLLILDEPTAGLDPYGSRVLHDELRAFANAGGAVLHSTHLLEQAERLCDQVAILKGGRITAQGSLTELRQRATADASLEALFFAATAP
jgi:ABC-2 type transport system ATP-binding protein